MNCPTSEIKSIDLILSCMNFGPQSHQDNHSRTSVGDRITSKSGEQFPTQTSTQVISSELSRITLSLIARLGGCWGKYISGERGAEYA